MRGLERPRTRTALLAGRLASSPLENVGRPAAPANGVASRDLDRAVTRKLLRLGHGHLDAVDEVKLCLGSQPSRFARCITTTTWSIPPGGCQSQPSLMSKRWPPTIAASIWSVPIRLGAVVARSLDSWAADRHYGPCAGRRPATRSRSPSATASPDRAALTMAVATHRCRTDPESPGFGRSCLRSSRP